MLLVFSKSLPELFSQDWIVILIVDAIPCKGMSLRTRIGEVNHISTHQLWAQGSIQSYGEEVHNLSRAPNARDNLTT